jgi:Zn-dependent protease with chaperone function
MHVFIVFAAILVALFSRLIWTISSADWNTRWRNALGTFLFAPLLLLTSAIAVFWMGPLGQMVHWWDGWGSYFLAVGFLAVAIVLGAQLMAEAQRSLKQVREMQPEMIQDIPVRLLESPTPFIAQVGLWNPELVISEGLLETLDDEHLTVAITHEQAHRYYRDTFWFFWLGWLRRLTRWLPNTETLWQELMVLRELRADRWAVQRVDNLLLAEALLAVVSASQVAETPWSAALSDGLIKNRLNERIDALLDESEPLPELGWSTWMWLAIAFLPFAVVPFHG